MVFYWLVMDLIMEKTIGLLKILGELDGENKDMSDFKEMIKTDQECAVSY